MPDGAGLVYIDDIRLYPKVFAAHTSNVDIAISAQANWWSQTAANREMPDARDIGMSATVPMRPVTS